MDLSLAAACSEPAKKAKRQQDEADQHPGGSRAAHSGTVGHGHGHGGPERMEVNSSGREVAASFNGDPQNNALDLTSHHDTPSSGSSIHTESQIRMSQIKFVRTLSENPHNKLYAYEGLYHEKPAVIVLEKTQMDEVQVKGMIEDSAPLEKGFVNDIYGSYTFHPNPAFNAVKATITHPANAKLIDKWMKQELRMLEESYDQYKNLTLPYITDHQLNVSWVYNILDGKEEQDRVIFSDPDPETGFILLPDMKWDQTTVTDLYLQAVCQRRDIKSLRDLTSDHMPLLQNILVKGCEAIHSKYGIGADELRIYVHYQPSYYHFHVHFTALNYQGLGILTERAHLLSTVIQNIRLMPDYYQRASLTFAAKITDPLYKLFQSS